MAGATTVVLAGGTLFTGGQVAHAATTVTNEAELRDAIAAANTDPGLDEIVIDAAEIVLNTYLPAIRSSVSITGRGSDLTTIKMPAGSDGYQVFHGGGVDGPLSVTVSGLTIDGGKLPIEFQNMQSRYSGALNDHVTIDDVVIKHGADTAIEITGIDNVTISDLEIYDQYGIEVNEAFFGDDGNFNVSLTDSSFVNVGGDAAADLERAGNVTISNVTISNLTGEFTSGISMRVGSFTYSDAAPEVTVTDVEVSGAPGTAVSVGNWATPNWVPTFERITVSDSGSGIGIRGFGSFSVSDSTFSGLEDSGVDLGMPYRVPTGAPDGWAPTWSVTVDDVTIADTTYDEGILAWWVGGYAFSEGELSLTITDTSISNVGGSGVRAFTGYGFGGSLAVTVTDTTITGAGTYDDSQSAGYNSGIFVGGADLTVVNSTITGSDMAGVAAYGYPGWYWQREGSIGTRVPLPEKDQPATVSISHSTITANGAEAVVSFGNRYFTYSQYNYDGRFPFGDPQTIEIDNTVTITHSILSGNDVDGTDAADVVNDTSGTTTVTWSLIDSDSAHIGGDNVANDDPMLGALADNGRSTLTMKPETGSPVIDAGNPAITGAPEFDQRGDSRIQGTIDIGAVEVAATPSGPGPGPNPGPTPRPAPVRISVPDSAGVDESSISPGAAFRVRAACRGSEDVRASFGGLQSTATCSTTTAGLGQPATTAYDGVARFEFDAPSEPGTYEVEILLVGSNESYSIPVVVSAAPETIPTTTPTTVPIAVTPSLPATGGGDRSVPTSLAAALFIAVGAGVSRIAKRRPF